jgi:hypothetical protein
MSRSPGYGPRLRRAGIALNIVFRLAMAAFAIEVLLNLDDPRFVDKGLGVRSVLILAVASLLIPGWHLWRRRGWRPGGAAYPVWYDNLYLTTFLLDQVGNSFDLYETYAYYDLIPHTLNSGVYTVIAAWLLRLSIPCAIGIATIGHVLFEIQEAYGDEIFGTRNVGGVMDTVNDLLGGLIGSVVYGFIYWRYVRKAGREPPAVIEPPDEPSDAR